MPPINTPAFFDATFNATGIRCSKSGAQTYILPVGVAGLEASHQLKGLPSVSANPPIWSPAEVGAEQTGFFSGGNVGNG